MNSPKSYKSTQTISEKTSASVESLTFSRTLLIFDFDDTLFCTKYFDTFSLCYTDIFEYNISLEKSHPKLIKELKELEKTIINIFKKLLMNYDIVIISNANLKWIENCLTHFLRELKEYITENNIKIYSAKNMYSKIVKNSNEWKTKCFKKVVKELYENEINNLDLTVISIGDNNDEKRAVFKLTKDHIFRKLTPKFIHMISFPSAASIILQLKYIEENICNIINEDKNIFKLGIELINSDVKIKCTSEKYKKNYETSINNSYLNNLKKMIDKCEILAENSVDKVELDDGMSKERGENYFLGKKLFFN